MSGGSKFSVHPFLVVHPFRRVVDAYRAGPIRIYCRIRAQILRDRMLREIGQYLPHQGDIAELGCGFGLFCLCFASVRPEARFIGCDLNSGRIGEAKAVAERLAITNVQFHAGDAVAFSKSLPPQDCVYMLDLVHHLPPAEVDGFIQAAWDALRPAGTLIIKDVSDRPWLKMAFTWILDVIMTKGEFPDYHGPERFLRLLTGMGGRVHAHYLDDMLPYPHVLYVAHKPT